MPKHYARNCLFGALGALLMLVGDLCLSVVPAAAGDSGLFAREAYLSGGFDSWRLPLLVGTGLAGMALGFFSVWAMAKQIRAPFFKTRRALQIGGAIYLVSAGALHLYIGTLADWTSRLAPILGREEATALVQEQYSRLMPSLAIAYAGMLLLLIGSLYALLAKKTILPRRMIAFHPIVWQVVLVLIPDLRQLCGAAVSTWDFVLSQGSGNAALLLWMVANAVWAKRQSGRDEIQ